MMSTPRRRSGNKCNRDGFKPAGQLVRRDGSATTTAAAAGGLTPRRSPRGLVREQQPKREAMKKENEEFEKEGSERVQKIFADGMMQNRSPRTKQPFRSPVSDMQAVMESVHVSGKPKQRRSIGKRRAMEGLTPLRQSVSDSGPALSPLRPPNASHTQQKVAVAVPAASPSYRVDFAGLPEDVQKKYVETRKISKLYDWQRECISDPRLSQGHNLIVSLPTGAGKTLVAEVMMLREAMVNGRSSILVLPYVSIVQEKMASLAKFEDVFDIHIEEYAANKGRFPPIERRNGKPSIFVATIEKANMLVNWLMETSSWQRLGLIVVDELHMIGEGGRGALIEQMLVKTMVMGGVQLIGMSATLSNMDQLATFIDAYVYHTDFRPVAFREFVRIGQTMWTVHPGGRLADPAHLPKNTRSFDTSGVLQLLEGVVPKNSVIIFCPTKKNCQVVAALVAKGVPKQVREHRLVERIALVDNIKSDGDGMIVPEMEQVLLAGIAWHHAGLTQDERKHIEAAYLDGVLCMLCATSTLAAGVNMPARRVIIKGPKVGIDWLGKAQYLQMIGRAGRAGFDAKGDSITIVHNAEEEQRLKAMLAGPMLSCTSTLPQPDTIDQLVVDCIALTLATCRRGLSRILGRSLAAIQKGEEGWCEKQVDESLERLQQRELIDDDGSMLSSSQRGSACFAAGVLPSEVVRMSEDLVNALNTGIVFTSHLHLLCIIAPYEVSCEVDWDRFHAEYKELPAAEKELLGVLGMSEKDILTAIVKRQRPAPGSSAMRLYLGLMLQRIWKGEENHWEIAARYHVERGWLQCTMQSAVSHAGCIARYAERVQSLWALRLLLPELVAKLSDCADPEARQLMQLDNVRRSRAKQLISAGYNNIGKVSRADAGEMCRQVKHLHKTQAYRIINAAKMFIRDRQDEQAEKLKELGLDS